MCSLILASKENRLVLERVLVCPRPQEVAVVRRVDVTAYLGDCGMAMSYTENWLQEVRALPSRCCVHLPTLSEKPRFVFRPPLSFWRRRLGNTWRLHTMDVHDATPRNSVGRLSPFTNLEVDTYLLTCVPFRTRREPRRRSVD